MSGAVPNGVAVRTAVPVRVSHCQMHAAATPRCRMRREACCSNGPSMGARWWQGIRNIFGLLSLELFSWRILSRLDVHWLGQGYRSRFLLIASDHHSLGHLSRVSFALAASVLNTVAWRYSRCIMFSFAFRFLWPTTWPIPDLEQYRIAQHNSPTTRDLEVNFGPNSTGGWIGTRATQNTLNPTKIHLN